MGSKNEPGEYDCYANAEPDEPMFILLGRDPMGPALVRLWAEMRAAEGEDPDKVREALDCAHWMETYALEAGKGDRLKAAESYIQTESAKKERARIVGHLRSQAKRVRNDRGQETVSSILLEEEAEAIEKGEV